MYAIIKTMCPPSYHHNGFVALLKCMSCHKVIVVITGRAHCFHDCICICKYITRCYWFDEAITHSFLQDQKKPHHHYYIHIYTIPYTIYIFIHYIPLYTYTTILLCLPFSSIEHFYLRSCFKDIFKKCTSKKLSEKTVKYLLDNCFFQIRQSDLQANNCYSHGF